jgi:indole-3-glycerol phosphate synthase
VQASRDWAPPTGTLGAIVAEARDRALELRNRESELARAVTGMRNARPFAAALRRDTVALIAEVKRRSPSKGWINPTMPAADQARAYFDGGAAAISVLTEPVHFGGSADDLTAIQAAVAIPTLKKDFHVDPIQLLEARALGASAALLIARALSPTQLELMMRTARELDLEALVEVRDEEELRRALDGGATIVGINNRNLETLEIDPRTGERMLRLVPPNVLAVAESGVASRSDVEAAARHGADAVLVGSVISSAADPAGAVRDLAGVGRVGRGG